MNEGEYAKMRALEDRYWWFVSRRQMARNWLAEFAPEGPVLDLGCGTGALLHELQTAGREAHGLDFSPLAIDFCRGRGLSNLTQGDAQSLPYPDASFQAVISLDTLEHVPDDTAAFAEIARVLRPGGVLIFNVPAFRWLWGPHDVALHHHRRYTPGEVRTRLGEAALKPERLSCGVFFLFPAVAALRLMDRLRRTNEVRLPEVGPGMNSALVRLMTLESRLISRVPLPWGSSVCGVARRGVSHS
ncbi:MAG: class I SAM-dependent methyltransferase [Fimbriimonadaceae bacterium]|nr:class I SAM-dependent methyltransferase [Fimbriimonadaceae bacterium]